MPMLVTKTYLVDTDDVDDAYQLTKIDSNRVGTFSVGQIRPYDPNAQQPGMSRPIAQPQQKA
jgi:hypothetical protein